MPVVVVDSGKFVSSAFVVRGDRPFVVECPSQSTGSAVFVEFAQTSGTAPWSRLQRADATGAGYTVHSGTGGAWGIVDFVPTPFGRIAVSSGPTAPMSYTVLELAR